MVIFSSGTSDAKFFLLIFFSKHNNFNVEAFSCHPNLYIESTVYSLERIIYFYPVSNLENIPSIFVLSTKLGSRCQKPLKIAAAENCSLLTKEYTRMTQESGKYHPNGSVHRLRKLVFVGLRHTLLMKALKRFKLILW